MRKKQTSTQRAYDLFERNNLKYSEKQFIQVVSVYDYFNIYGEMELKSQSSLKVLPEMVRCGVDNFYIRRLKKSRALGYAITLKKFLLLYGRLGYYKWESYKEKQSISNKFEYKQKKYGMTKDEFNDYNKSRSITEENMIKKYGDIDGLLKWESYKEKQAYAGCKLEYFIDKNNGDYDLGLIEYTELNKKKAHTVDSYMLRDPNLSIDEAILLFEKSDIGNKSLSFSSKISQDLCWYIYNYILTDVEKEKCYFTSLNKEFVKFSKDQWKPYKYDFVVSSINFCLEFNGDYYHANPLLYDESYTGFYFNKEITAKGIWQKDKIKNDYIESLGYNLLVVWEYDYKNNFDMCIEEIKNAIELSRRLHN